MLHKIDSDRARFLHILKGKIREDLNKYLSNEDFWGKLGGKFVKLKVEGIHIPHIVYGKEQEGVGQGDGKEGDVIGEDAPAGPSKGGGGDSGGEHHLEIEFSEDEILDIISQDLELPRLEPKGKKTLTTPVGAYTGVRPVGPESLRIFKRSYKKALRRSIASGCYRPDHPIILINPEDKRYKAQKNSTRPYASAVLILLKDISGSMDEDFTKVVRVVSRMFDFWVHQHYKWEVDVRYFFHDTELSEVTQDDYYKLSSGGGTKFGPAYKELTKIIDKDHPYDLWNVYVCHFTDGDNFMEDNEDAKDALPLLISKTNLTAYFEVGPLEISHFHWGGYTQKRDRKDLFGEQIKHLVDTLCPRFRIAFVEKPEDAYDRFRSVLV